MPAALQPRTEIVTSFQLLMRIVGDRGPAGSLARIALPLALLVPLIASVIALSGQRAGYYGTEAAVAIALFASALVNCVLLGAWTVALYRSDAERRARDAAIARSEQHYRHAEGVAHIGYWRVEFPSQTVQWSDGFLEICGLPKNTPPGLKTAVGIYHPEDSVMAHMALATAQEDCSDWEFSCRVRRPDGDIRHVKSRGVCERNADGKTTEIFGVILDVSDLESARREAEAAKATTATFLANMSHEIRTPMNGVMGFVELLLDSKLDGAQRRHLSLIQDSANALLKLLNDILDVSKIEAGRLEIAEAPYNIRRGIKQCVRLMSPMAEAKGLSLSLSLRNDVPANLITDGLRLRQILLNLIGNAVKFTHLGVISVVIAKGIRGDGRDTLRVSVEDSGIGIHPDRRATIFGAFVQAELTTTRRFGGSGLGLSISRQLAEMMGGTIEVDSVLGKGTKMTLVLPLIESSATEVAEAAEFASVLPRETAPPEPNSAQASVLLVEDVDINQELFSEMLVRLGHRFQIASDGAEAVELARRLRTEPDAWDLILMDLQMPVMDGLAATTAIREMGGRAATIPIIALTASAFEKERRQCNAAGMNDHLAKPVGVEALRRMIDRWQATHEAPANAIATEEAGPVRSASLDRRIKARLRSSADRLTDILERVSESSPDEFKLLLIEARKIAHVLAGTAGMVGEKALGDLASSVEAAIEASVEAGSSDSLVLARTAIEALVAALTAEQASKPALQVRTA